MNIKSSFCAVLLVCFTQYCISQTNPVEILTTAGGYNSSASGALSWTLGETIIETGIAGSNSLTEGFQQPSTASVMAVNNMEANDEITAYPNPAVDIVFIKGNSTEPLKLDIIDINGRILSEQELQNNNDREVNMTNYTNGTYFFKVYQLDGQLVNTIKIEKVK